MASARVRPEEGVHGGYLSAVPACDAHVMCSLWCDGPVLKCYFAWAAIIRLLCRAGAGSVNEEGIFALLQVAI